MYAITGAILVLVFTIAIICETLYHTYKIYMTWAHGEDVGKYRISYDPVLDRSCNDGPDFCMAFMIRMLAWVIGVVILFIFWPGVLIGAAGVYIARQHRASILKQRDTKSSINLRKD